MQSWDSEQLNCHNIEPDKDKCYIYTLESNKDGIRYVGFTVKSLKNRLNHHLNEKLKKSHKINWLNKCRKSKDVISIKLIDIVSREEWQFWEKYWISQFKSWNFKLTNSTEGGDGTLGFKFSKETKDHFSRIRKGVKPSPESVRKRSREVIMLNLNGWPENLFTSVREAERETGIKNGDILNVCKGKTKTAGGYSWCFCEDFLDFHEYLRDNTITPTCKRKVNQITVEGEFVKQWESASEAARELNTKSTTISAICSKRKHKITAAGFKWEFVE